ncbi:MAG: hypothetical protein WAU86_22715 [Oricola sp.]
MSVSTALSAFMLQTASAKAPVLAYPESPTGILSSSPFSMDFLIHAGFIWAALIGICVIVFAYRRRGKAEKRGFPDTYQDELDAMRKGRND